MAAAGVRSGIRRGVVIVAKVFGEGLARLLATSDDRYSLILYMNARVVLVSSVKF